jgi:hypothetical protein
MDRKCMATGRVGVVQEFKSVSDLLCMYIVISYQQYSCHDSIWSVFLAVTSMNKRNLRIQKRPTSCILPLGCRITYCTEYNLGFLCRARRSPISFVCHRFLINQDLQTQVLRTIFVIISESLFFFFMFFKKKKKKKTFHQFFQWPKNYVLSEPRHDNHS